ncbi:hypothetical protein HYT24_00980 [Candidatus Pacearchaeota archaeon]|nr:hypothetical protein [Candidatus Pacearchaeota archaeon]
MGQSGLESTIRNMAITAIAGTAAVGLVEYTGFAEHVQAYELAKAELVREFFGEFAGKAAYVFAHSIRTGIDVIAGLTAGLLAYSFKKS